MEQMLPMLLPFIIVLIQLADSYLRYLSFGRGMTEKEKGRLLSSLAFWGLFSFFAYNLLFENFGICVSLYKAVLMLGWIPFLAIFMLAVRRNPLQHIFVHGMMSLWSFSLHSLSSIAVVLCFADRAEDILLSLHGLMYPAWFLLFLPIERHFFQRMLPPNQFFTARPYGYYIAALPYVILFSHILLIADGKLLHSWQERFSRLVLPVSFFFLYRHALISGKEFYARRKTQRDAHRLEKQFSFLERRHRLVVHNQKRLSVLRRDLRHDFRILYTMLQDGKIEDAISHIKSRRNLLEAPPPLAGNALVDSAISVQFWRAKRLGIHIRREVHLPSGEENPTEPALHRDLALLVSALLGNAIDASEKLAENSREISFVLASEGRKWKMEIINRSSCPPEFGKDGLPRRWKDAEGSMGTGMKILSMFLSKYNARAQFSCKDSCVTCLVAWEVAP
ncbi:MAG: GHKL domain-containing protein [Selenomonadaceae bacterium]|nr:GHKL domain-containing protein [Selenomonadaceae bacterium]